MKILDKILFRFIESCIEMISKRNVRRGLMSKSLAANCFACFMNSPLPMKHPDVYVSMLRRGLIVLRRPSGELLSRDDVLVLLDGK